MTQEPGSDVDVAKIAELARIELTAQEQEEMARELHSVLEYVNQLMELDVTDVEPTAHATRITNVDRPDQHGPSLDRDRVLQNAPAVQEDTLIQVPRVIQEEGGA